MRRYSGFTFITGLSFPSSSFFFLLLTLRLCSSSSSSSSGSKFSMLDDEEEKMADMLACACRYACATLNWAGVNETAPVALRASQVPRHELLQK